MSRRQVRLVTVAVLVTFTVAASALGVALHQRHDDRGQQQAATQALAAARTIVPDLLTYRAAGIDADFARKYGLLTGNFQQDFRALSEQTIIPSAKQRTLVTDAKVAQAGLVDSTAQTATVLMFINQSTTSADDTEPTLDGSRVRVSLIKVGDVWKVSGLQPV